MPAKITNRGLCCRPRRRQINLFLHVRMWGRYAPRAGSSPTPSRQHQPRAAQRLLGFQDGTQRGMTREECIPRTTPSQPWPQTVHELEVWLLARLRKSRVRTAAVAPRRCAGRSGRRRRLHGPTIARRRSRPRVARHHHTKRRLLLQPSSTPGRLKHRRRGGAEYCSRWQRAHA